MSKDLILGLLGIAPWVVLFIMTRLDLGWEVDAKKIMLRKSLTWTSVIMFSVFFLSLARVLNYFGLF